MLPETTFVVSLILCAGSAGARGPLTGWVALEGPAAWVWVTDVLRPVGNNQSTRLITLLPPRLQHRRLGE